MPETKRATILDVARRAGVSTTTVSFVLNHNPNEKISVEARHRVLDAVRSLAYYPSAAAASLARKRLRNVGIILYKEDEVIANQFYAFVVQGAVKEAVEHDYNILFSYVEANFGSHKRLPKIVREKNAEGVLFLRRVERNMAGEIVKLGIPVVTIDTFPRITGIDAVMIDDRRGGGLAAEHLLHLGHRQLGMLLPLNPAPSIAERLDGFRDALSRCGVAISFHIVEASSLTFEAARAATVAALAQKPMTAVFCANDEMAAGVLRAAREMGRQVPEDLSVVGFDDIAMSSYTDPPLTTVGVGKEHMGRRAMARLIELVEGVDMRARVELAGVELIVRSSTAQPPHERIMRFRSRRGRSAKSVREK